MRPIKVDAFANECWNIMDNPNVIQLTQTAYKQLRKTGKPEISVVIPAYNEEKNILKALYSLCNNITDKAVEIIVVNNNSIDKTQELVLSTGVSCILETKKGISSARNAGLAVAKGEYVLTADSDTIYPKYWIAEMMRPFYEKNNIALVYGRFSFIPIGKTSRLTYFFYEYFADFFRFINKYLKDEAVNVYGFSSGFRREQGIAVDGFTHPFGSGEDGWFALKLREKGYGKLYAVTNPKALAWTTDRRIQMDGGLGKGIITRLKRVILRRGNDRTDL